jgi:ArsR family transcriptional regulator
MQNGQAHDAPPGQLGGERSSVYAEAIATGNAASRNGNDRPQEEHGHVPPGTVAETPEGLLIEPLLTLDSHHVQLLAELFRLLSDRTRLSILQLLSGGETNVGKLCEQLELPQPTVSHHLALLRLNGLINNRRSGKQVFYKLNGRISPAAVGKPELLAETEAGQEVTSEGEGHGHAKMPAGMQIQGTGFSVQILSDREADPEAAAKR